MDTNGSERIICSDHIGLGPDTGSIDAADSSPVYGSVKVDTVIGDLITSPVKVGQVNVVDIPIRLDGNTYECLVVYDDVATLEVAVECDPSRDGIPTIPVISGPPPDGAVSSLSGVRSLDYYRPGLPSLAEFSDTSPNCETFKHIKGMMS